MKSSFLNIDWKSEPILREKVLFAVIPLLLLVPALRGLWLPVEGAINKTRADLKMIKAQSATITKMLDVTSREAQAAAQSIPEDAKSAGRAVRILSRQTGDRNQEVANAVSTLSSREIASRVQVKNIAVGKEVFFPTYAAVPVDVILEGGYASIERYLKTVEDIERPFLVRGLSIARSKAEGSILDARITLWVYLAGSSPPPQKK